MRRIWILTLLALVACENKPLEVAPTDNSSVTVSKLFTHEGCTVYRFHDSRTHYYVRCDGNYRTASVSETHAESYPCGKSTCVRYVPQTIQTLRR